MATDTTTPKPTDTKAATPKRKPAAKSRTRTAAKPRKPAAAKTTSTPRPQAKALNGGQQFVAGVIDAQEKTVTALVDYQARAAEFSRIPGATAIADAQAQVLRSFTDVYVSTARTFLK
jgi:hypothetical protein